MPYYVWVGDILRNPLGKEFPDLSLCELLLVAAYAGCANQKLWKSRVGRMPYPASPSSSKGLLFAKYAAFGSSVRLCQPKGKGCSSDPDDILAYATIALSKAVH